MQPQTVASGTLPMYYSGLTSFDVGTGTVSLGELSSISFQGQNPWSIELWFLPDVLIDQMTLVSRAGEFQLLTQGEGLWAARTHQNSPVRATGLLTAGEWVYIAVTFNGATMSLFVNGAFVTSSSLNDPGVAPTGNPMLIGGGFYGQINSARFWNVCITSSQISNNQWNLYPSGTAGLVAQMDFSQNPPVDTSGNGVQATFSEGISYRSQIPAMGFTGNGFCNPYNDGGVNPAGVAADFTVMGWICPTGLGEAMAIFTNGSQDAGAGMSLMMMPSGSLQFQVGSSSPLTSSAVLASGEWYHTAVTWSATSASGTIFLNGAEDSSATGMSLASSQTVGTPLIGAIADSQTQLPVASFQGLIQMLGVFSGALSASGIQTYMSQDPIIASGCLADYSLALFPPQNNISQNPVGTAAGAYLTVQEEVTEENLDDARRRPMISSELAFEPMPFEPLVLARCPPDLQKAATEAYLEFLRSLQLDADVEAQMIELFQDNLARGIEDAAGGTHRTTFSVQTQAAGQPELALSPCTFWIIQLIAAIMGALMVAFGFVLNAQKWLNGFTTFLGTRINSIGLAPQLVATFNNGVTANAIFGALRLLQEYSLLMPLLRLSRQLLTSSVGLFTILSVGARIALIFSPAAPLEAAWLVAQLAYSISMVVTVIQKRPANCP
jgi:Concanavalin A-like lectin/glucanases superfamily